LRVCPPPPPLPFLGRLSFLLFTPVPPLLVLKGKNATEQPTVHAKRCATLPLSAYNQLGIEALLGLLSLWKFCRLYIVWGHRMIYGENYSTLRGSLREAYREEFHSPKRGKKSPRRWSANRPTRRAVSPYLVVMEPVSPRPSGRRGREYGRNPRPNGRPNSAGVMAGSSIKFRSLSAELDRKKPAFVSPFMDQARENMAAYLHSTRGDWKSLDSLSLLFQNHIKSTKKDRQDNLDNLEKLLELRRENLLQRLDAPSAEGRPKSPKPARKGEFSGGNHSLHVNFGSVGEEDRLLENIRRRLSPPAKEGKTANKNVYVDNLSIINATIKLTSSPPPSNSKATPPRSPVARKVRFESPRDPIRSPGSPNSAMAAQETVNSLLAEETKRLTHLWESMNGGEMHHHRLHVGGKHASRDHVPLRVQFLAHASARKTLIQSVRKIETWWRRNGVGF
jgi:hypothetical protein